MANPYENTTERDRPAEWTELEHHGSGDPGILKVEWDPTTDCWRSSGPKIQIRYPERPL